MRRINTSTSINGRFRNGNKSTGTKATQFNAEWCNAVQEEICKLIEATGLTVDGSEDQLKHIFTVLYALDATLKSAAFRKTFSGGYSDIVVSGEKILAEAHGSVADQSNSELSRMGVSVNKPDGAGSGGASDVEITATGIVVKHTDSLGNVVKTEMSRNEIKTITEFLQVLIGTTPVSEHGRKLIVDSTLEIGGVAGSQRGENLVVNGKSTFKNGVNIGNIITLDATTSTCNLTELGGMAGDVVTVYCDGVTGEITVDVNGAQPHPRHVSIESYCAMSFMYIKSHELSGGVTIHRWAPMHDVSFTYPT